MTRQDKIEAEGEDEQFCPLQFHSSGVVSGARSFLLFEATQTFSTSPQELQVQLLTATSPLITVGWKLPLANTVPSSAGPHLSHPCLLKSEIKATSRVQKYTLPITDAPIWFTLDKDKHWKWSMWPNVWFCRNVCRKSRQYNDAPEVLPKTYCRIKMILKSFTEIYFSPYIVPFTVHTHMLSRKRLIILSFK